MELRSPEPRARTKGRAVPLEAPPKRRDEPSILRRARLSLRRSRRLLGVRFRHKTLARASGSFPLAVRFRSVKAIRAAFLGAAAIACVLAIAHHVVGVEGSALLVASMGASAVLLFSVPEGKLSQPWPLIGGHALSAVVGVTCAKLIGNPTLASALAVGTAIGVMELFECTHPPGGATALSAVVGGPATHALGYGYVLTPVLLNVGIIFATALFLHAPRRAYPHRTNR